MNGNDSVETRAQFHPFFTRSDAPQRFCCGSPSVQFYWDGLKKAWGTLIVAGNELEN